MKISEISEGLKSIIKNTANKLSGAERREYIGEIATELLNGNPRKAEGVFGWGRETVKTYGVILASFFLTSKSLINCLYCHLFLLILVQTDSVMS
jgi:hypothetical protein